MNEEVESATAASEAAEPPEPVTEIPTVEEAPIAKIMSVDGGTATAVADETMLEDQSGDKRLFIGSVVRIKVGDNLVYGAIRSVSLERSGDGNMRPLVEIEFLAQAERDQRSGNITAQRGISSHPMPGDPLFRASDEDLELLFSAGGKEHFTIGTVYPTHRVPATVLTEQLMTRHFAMLGSTGTGKSTATALFVHKIVESMPEGHIIILDPHNEYKGAFSDISVHFDSNNLRLPYWLMNLEEMIELLVGRGRDDREEDIDILRKAVLAARKKSASRDLTEKLTVDTPVPYRLADLTGEIDDAMGQLNKAEGIAPFLRLKARIEELRSDKRYNFMFSGLLISDTLVDIVSSMLRLPTDGKPVTTLDLSGIPADIVDVVVSVLCRLVFDFAVWTSQEHSQPVLVICEEAHRYVPAETSDEYGAARGAIERIAKEGRKYGVSLGLVSQRPSDLSETVLAQCGTIVTMRMNNDRDRAFVESAMPEGSKGFLESLPALQNREAILSGEGVAAPMRVRFAYLEESKRPSSTDPDFATHWRTPVGSIDFVQDTITKWRTQVRR